MHVLCSNRTFSVRDSVPRFQYSNEYSQFQMMLLQYVMSQSYA